MTIPTITLSLETTDKTPNSSYLRGFIAGQYPELDILHNRDKSGKHIYRYPLVQYKKVNGQFMMLGLQQEAVQLLSEFFLKLDELSLNEKTFQITGKNVNLKKHEVTIDSDLNYHYAFKTPYIALNEKNMDRYYRSPEPAEVLEKILTGNILSFLKGMDIFVKERIQLEFFKEEESVQKIKENDFVQFRGRFKSNIALPNYIGLGKFVSRGFGTIFRLKN